MDGVRRAWRRRCGFPAIWELGACGFYLVVLDGEINHRHLYVVYVLGEVRTVAGVWMI